MLDEWGTQGLLGLWRLPFSSTSCGRGTQRSPRLTRTTPPPGSCWLPGRTAWGGGRGSTRTSLVHPAALLVYRVFRKEAKRTTKVLHGLLHVLALITALVGEFLGEALPPSAHLPFPDSRHPSQDTGCRKEPRRPR